ncbi:TOBE domain-containing protein [Leucobacter sp. W1153]|uniref:TOBE domain-containing protein n=1 Tax=Leucobacter sp. W1153 TaxID=3439064 RepID=UPI003F2A0A71
MSDRIAVFNNGRIEQVGSAEELYETPQTLFVGRFLGESTVLVGKGVASGAGRTAVDVAGHRIEADGVRDEADLAILIRPENLRLEPAGTQVTGDRNSIPVTVLDVTYLGSSRRYTVRLPDGAPGTVRLSNEARAFGLGEDAVMTWGVESGVLLVDTGEAGESAT